jgi:hypothetical protein
MFDLKAIEQAMEVSPVRQSLVRTGHVAVSVAGPQELSLAAVHDAQLSENFNELMAEREGFEPDSGTLSDQQFTDSENNLVPSDTLKTL